MKKQFTIEQLKNSEEFKTYIQERVVLIHDVYYDSGDDYAAYIVISTNIGKFTITRFFLSVTEKIKVSVDYENKSSEEVFKLLLTEYSTGLK